MTIAEFLKLDIKNTNYKIYADIFESLATSILLDGGLSELNKVYGKILNPFISYYLKYSEEFY